MCNATYEGREHVPPLCFFPEEKDISGSNYRKKLITVPSCALHNTAKSKDDEYLLFCILSHFNNNNIAIEQFKTKAVRALKRRPSLASFFNNRRRVLLKDNATFAYKIDTERFEKGMMQIVKGLYFHKYNEKWLNEIVIHTTAIFQLDSPNYVNICKGKTELEQFVYKVFANSTKNGENQDIFWYQISADKSNACFCTNMMFYGGFNIIALSHPDLLTKQINGIE